MFIYNILLNTVNNARNSYSLQEKRGVLKIHAICAKYCMQFTACYEADSLLTVVCFFAWKQHDSSEII
jgi:hypothetical protein